jgi:hypothetical protein
MNILGATFLNHKPNDRKENWFRFYHCLRDKFDADFLVAAADDREVSRALRMPVNIIPESDLSLPHLEPFMLNIITFDAVLPDRVNMWTYPRYWRSFHGLMRVAKAVGAERLLHLETDAWVYTQRLADRFKSHTPARADGHDRVACPWCPRYRMAELMLGVYHRSIFDPLLKFIESKTWEEWAQPQPMDFETAITINFGVQIWRDMIGDRYSEDGRPLPANADFSVQDDVSVPVWRG